MFLKYRFLIYTALFGLVMAYALANHFFFDPGPEITASSPSEQSEITPVKSEVVVAPVQLERVADRSVLMDQLKAKKANGQALVVHVFVPLCDNDHQGIVKVSKSLGDGFNPRSNLYWGAAYGVSTFFKRAADWELLDKKSKVSDEVLERQVFFNKKRNVYLVADAYRGDKMNACMTDFLAALSGEKMGQVDGLNWLNGESIDLYQDADLLVFNGHNGLMDVRVPKPSSKDGVHREAAVIACASYGYFAPIFDGIGTFPVITTRNLLAPEAYVLKAMVEAWADLKSEAEIRESIAAAYHKYQKCGLRGARNLFQPGWKD